MNKDIEPGIKNKTTENIEAKKWEDLKNETPFVAKHTEKPIDPQVINRIAQSSRNIAAGVEADYYRYINSQAKKEGVPADKLLTEVRAITKELRFGKNKDNIKFYHSTSIEGLSRILESGQLLSRKERKARGEDISKLPWSSSENVQFSYDQIDENGKMVSSGLGGGRGASGSEISFVFGGDLIDEETFESAPSYPTVEKVNISKKCLGIIVNNAEKADKVESILKAKNIDIPVYTTGEYDTRISPKSLQELKARQQSSHNIDV